MPQVYRLNYQPDLDTNWEVNPGAVTSMSGFAPMQDSSWATVDVDGNAGFAITGGDCLHAEMFEQISGAVRLLVFRAQNIDEYDSSGTRTNRGTGYNASTADWSAVSWGNQIIACNYLDATQSSTGAGFSALGGSSPKARYAAANVNFVVLADVDDGGSNVYGDMVWWSAIRNPSSWAPSLATQAGNIRLLDSPGPIRQIVAYGDKFIAFKENAIFVGQYVGPPYVFSWKLVNNTIGCSYPKSVTECDGRLFWVHRNGVYSFDGQQIENIGRGVFSSLNNDTVDTAIWNVRARGDETQGIVWFCTNNSVVSTFTQHTMYAHAYNVRTRQWTRVGSVCSSSASANNSRPCIVFGARGEYYSFKSSFALVSGFLWIDNAASPSLDLLKAPGTTESAYTVTTGYIGQNDAAQTLVRIYPRLDGGGSTPFGGTPTATVNAYSTDYGASYTGTYTFPFNSTNRTFDGTCSARFIEVILNVPSGESFSLVGLGVDVQSAGKV